MASRHPSLPLTYGLGRLVTTIGNWAFKRERYSNDLNRYHGRILASYTAHLDRPRFTVEVPGSPPIYTPQGFPYKLDNDHKLASHLETSPIATFPTRPSGLEWSLRASRFTSPHFKLSDLDIITNATNLNFLLSFFNPSKDLLPMRLHAELHGTKSLVLNPWFGHDIRIPYIISRPKAYGITFEGHNTHSTNGAHPMLSHHTRMVGYKLGGLQFAVARQIDAVVPQWNGPIVFPRALKRETPLMVKHDEFTLIHTGGQPVSGPVAEMKTAASLTHMDEERMEQWKKYIATAWFSYIPNIICGVYDGEGYFVSHDMIDMKTVGREWVKQNRETLQKVLLLLQMMREEVQRSGMQRLAFVKSPGEQFWKVYELDGTNLRMVPEDVAKMF